MLVAGGGERIGGDKTVRCGESQGFGKTLLDLGNQLYMIVCTYGNAFIELVIKLNHLNGGF